MSDGYEAGMDVPRAVAPSPDVGERTLRAARSGDVAAFEEIVRHYDARLRGLAHRLLGDAGLMDDALQEAYVKAFRALPGFSGRSTLGTWLYRIAYNACIDQMRGRPDVAVARDFPAPNDPEAEVVRRMTLQAALASLPLDQRSAVLLVDAEGLSYAEAAHVLGCREGTVASRLSRGREALRAALDDSHATEVSR
jgi:RNA polymerase sigma-70 factor, ECF subfamily